MRRRPLTVVTLLPITLLLAVVLAMPALAHHGWSSYDAEREMTIEANIDQVHYRNPHASIDVTHAGNLWHVVLAPIARMAARGLPDGALQQGKTVTITGYPRHDGTLELRAERIVIDGKTIQLR